MEVRQALVDKHRDLSSIPGTHVLKSAAMQYSCNTSTGEAEIGRALGLWSNNQSVKLQASKGYIKGGRERSGTKREDQGTQCKAGLCPAYVHTYT